jgi:hypoxanthine phosphoribosyltransferase
MLNDIERTLLHEQTILRRLDELGEQITRDYDGRDLTVIAVLNGSILFVADLMRRMTIPVVVDFVRARSYEGTESNGGVALTLPPETPLEGRDVVIVEDILDTGRTLHAIREWVRAKQPASVALCVLLDKPSRRRVDIEADFTGLVIGDHFVVGYGLDYEQQGRQFPDIGVLEGME